jgi:hypothetical protein
MDDAEDTGDPAPGADPDQNEMIDPADPDPPVTVDPDEPYDEYVAEPAGSRTLCGTWLPWPCWARLASIRFSRAAR